MIGALSEDRVLLSGLAPSGDVASTAAALRLLGARIELAPDGAGGLGGAVHGGEALRTAPAGDGREVLRDIDCGNSGTTMRLLAGLAAGIGRSVRLDGDASLRRRPVDRVLAPLRAMGATVDARDDRLPPLEVHGGALRAITWTSPVASAQIKSAVLLAGLGADGPTSVISPAPSRDHTERMLRHGGRTVTTTLGPDGSEHVTLVPGPVRLDALSASRDPSAAAFWHVAAACGAGRILTPDLCLNPGRTGALEVLQALGADVRVEDARDIAGEPVGTVAVGPGFTGDAQDGPVLVAGDLVVRSIDELPILALAGAMSARGLEVRDAAELRVKESDRISAVARLFAGLGMRFEEREDGFRVPGGQRPGPGGMDAHGDHRLAMTAAIAATVGTGPVTIEGFESVATSYPAFLDDLTSLGGRWESIDA